jgi:hypothetical protein
MKSLCDHRSSEKLNLIGDLDALMEKFLLSTVLHSSRFPRNLCRKTIKTPRAAHIPGQWSDQKRPRSHVEKNEAKFVSTEKKSHSNICMQNSASMMLFSLLKRRRAWHTESVRARTLYFLAATNGNFIHSDLAPNGILLMGKLFSCCSPSLSHPRLSVSTAEQELNSVSLLKAHRLQHV